jgi:hypothetical protein
MMPIHDWTKVDSGIFHDFHQRFSMSIADELNGCLPVDHYAMIEQNITKKEDGRYGPDVIALHEREYHGETGGGVVTLPSPPKTATRMVTEAEFYRRKKNIVAVRHVSDDRIVACIELVSPGNKAGRRSFGDFITKSCELLMRGIHLVIIDLFPPSPRDPQGIHNAIWEELHGEPGDPLPAGGDRVAVSYECETDTIAAYPEVFSVGGKLPDIPVFLRPGGCVILKLEESYISAYRTVPARWRRVIDG